MRVAIATVGCKVNQYESRALEQALAERGHVVVGFGEDAEAVVVNSCTVTHKADRDVRALVRRARREHPDACIVVTGCYAQTDPGALQALGVDLVAGTGEKSALPDLLEAGAKGVHRGDLASLGVLEPQPVLRFGDRTRAFLKVQDGCQAFCAYCIVPHARGPSRSLPLAEVERGLARIGAAGHGEVVLTGVHLGLWGRDLDPAADLGTLLDAAEDAGIPRVRLSSLEPGELSTAILDRIAASRVLCPHLHIPLQSGSDRILAAMGRPYRAAEFHERMRAALDAIPGLCLGFDVIVGFPGEDEAAFGETEELLQGLPFAYLHVFPFSPRKGTPAASLPQRVPAPVARERARRLRALSGEKRQAFHRAALGSILPALPEAEVAGGGTRLRSRNYIPVLVPARGLVGAGEVRVRLERVEGTGVRGSLLDRGGRGD